VEIDQIVGHVMNDDGISATWTVHMVTKPQGVYDDVEGTFFYDTPTRKRIWNEYITDKFSR
jgi:hypothetical protein